MASAVGKTGNVTGFQGDFSELVASSTAGMPNRSLDNETCAREGLRIHLVKGRKALTTREHFFLEQLITHGNDDEVLLACEKLQDETIFFENSWEEEREILGSELNSCLTSRPNLDIQLPPPLRAARQSSRESSERAQRHLEQRRNSGWHGQIWRAHEIGVAAARKSAIQRSNSVSRIPDIHREAAIRDPSFSSPMTSHMLPEGNTTTIRRSSLRRLTSEGSRKSVSFMEDAREETPMSPWRIRKVDRQISTEKLGPERVASPPWLFLAKPVRSESLNSIPSLHHGEILESDSSITSSSIYQLVARTDDSTNAGVSSTALHRAHPVRSDSAAVSSLGSFHSVDETDEDEAAWSAPLRVKPDVSKGQLLRHPLQAGARPILLRSASNNDHKGEGIEVSEMDNSNASSFQRDPLITARNLASMVSIGDVSERSIKSSSSYDDDETNESIFRETQNNRPVDDLRSYYLGAAKELLKDTDNTLSETNDANDPSWDLDSETGGEHFDAWNVLRDEYAVGYGANNTLPFLILGTSADDIGASPHVLSPPLMDSLRNFFPYSLSEDNFWMKYSLLRDGASLHSLLQHSRGAKYTIIAIETVDGEVFGSFTADPWRKDWNYFGSGEAFLWRMRQVRGTPCHSITEQAQLESELDVYPWTGDNTCVQLCTNEKIAVGGGIPLIEKADNNPVWGFGLALDRDLLHGTSSHCATFASPPLSHIHAGSPFEIANIEVWTTTPCYNLEDAEKLEMGKLFLQTN